MASFLTKGLKKLVEKIDSETLHYGFEEKELWVSTGNYALNRMMSGSYYRAMCYGQTQLIGGVSGSGKSLVLATTALQAQNDGAHIIWIDCENATKQKWLADVGLKVDEENGDAFSYIQAAKIDDIKEVIANIVKMYDENKKKTEIEQPIFIVVDSYSMTLTSKQVEEAIAGKSKGDQGQHAKQTKDLIKGINALIVRRPILVAGIVHTMESQDQYQPDEIILGGRGAQYIAATVLVFSRYKLKTKEAKAEGLQIASDDEKEVVGLRCKATIRKSRYSRPETSVDMNIVFGRGIDKYSGLFDLLMDEGIIIAPKQGYYQLSVAIPGVKQPGDSWRKKDFPGPMADVVVRYLEDNAEKLVLAPVKIKDEADIIAPEMDDE